MSTGRLLINSYLVQIVALTDENLNSDNFYW